MEAMRYACEHWHYSLSLPSGKLIIFGAWEDDCFVGIVAFGRGANRSIAAPYGLDQTEVVELVRVAMRNHATPTSRIVAIALRLLVRSNPGLRLVVSFADEKAGHHGGIYQAGNWIYTGPMVQSQVKVNRVLTHKRTVSLRYGTASVPWLRENVDSNASWVEMPPKHKYVYPLDKDLRAQITALAQPYPKRLCAN